MEKLSKKILPILTMLCICMSVPMHPSESFRAEAIQSLSFSSKELPYVYTPDTWKAPATWLESFKENPDLYIVGAILIATSVFLFLDILSRNETVINYYNKWTRNLADAIYKQNDSAIQYWLSKVTPANVDDLCKVDNACFGPFVMYKFGPHSITALEAAIMFDKKDVIEQLISKGADPNKVFSGRIAKPALKDPKLLMLLLNHGLNPNSLYQWLNAEEQKILNDACTLVKRKNVIGLAGIKKNGTFAPAIRSHIADYLSVIDSNNFAQAARQARATQKEANRGICPSRS